MIYIVIRFTDRDGIVFEGTEVQFRKWCADGPPLVVTKEGVSNWAKDNGWRLDVWEGRHK
jgi:hypothetical protein